MELMQSDMHIWLYTAAKTKSTKHSFTVGLLRRCRDVKNAKKEQLPVPVSFTDPLYPKTIDH